MVKARKPATSFVEFTTRIGLLEYLPGMHYLEVPKSAVQALGGSLRQRVRVRFGRTLEFRGGFMALGQGRAYISISKARLKAIGAKLGDRLKVRLEIDRETVGESLSDELRELLAQDAKGRARFEALTPGKQRMIAYYVGGVKSPDKRLERAIELIENLKALPEGKESPRQIFLGPSASRKRPD